MEARKRNFPNQSSTVSHACRLRLRLFAMSGCCICTCCHATIQKWKSMHSCKRGVQFIPCIRDDISTGGGPTFLSNSYLFVTKKNNTLQVVAPSSKVCNLRRRSRGRITTAEFNIILKSSCGFQDTRTRKRSVHRSCTPSRPQREHTIKYALCVLKHSRIPSFSK